MGLVYMKGATVGVQAVTTDYEDRQRKVYSFARIADAITDRCRKAHFPEGYGPA
jgi:hypothetical protein